MSEIASESDEAVNTKLSTCEVPMPSVCRFELDHGEAGAISGDNCYAGCPMENFLPDRIADLDLEPGVVENPKSTEDSSPNSSSSYRSPVPVKTAVFGLSHSVSSIKSSDAEKLSDLAHALHSSPSLPFQKHMDVTRVCDGLYLSDFMSLSACKLRELNVTFVVNATKELPNVEDADSSVEFLKLFVDDIRTQEMSQHFDPCADKIHDLRTRGGVSLIHCALGISRSVTICLAYLVKYGGCTLRQAYIDLKKKRQIIRPNDGFWRQLIAFETTVLGRPSVKLLVYPMGVIPDVYKSAQGRQRYNF